MLVYLGSDVVGTIQASFRGLAVSSPPDGYLIAGSPPDGYLIAGSPPDGYLIAT